MPVFEYHAIDPKGKDVKGLVDAESVRAARQKLRGQGIYPTSMQESKAAVGTPKGRDLRRYFQAQRIGTRDLSVLTRQLATLINAGLPLVSALNALSDQTDSAVAKRTLIDIREQVEGGQSLAKALAAFPRSFPSLYINMVASGEASGTLDTVLDNLADYLDAQVELRRRIVSALMYPCIMLVLCTAVIIGLMVFVVPNIVEIFRKQKAVLPLPTRITVFVSDALQQYWWIGALAIVAVIVYVRWWYRQPTGRERIDRALLRLPVFGALYTKVLTARVSGTLGTLLSSGVGLLTGLEIVRNIVQNVIVQRTIDEARDGVREGRSLARELTKARVFPSMLGHMVAVGEKSGELEEMLVKAGRAYQNEVNGTLSSLTALIEPLMLLIVGGVVLCIVISVLLPMADMINIVQR